MADVADLPAVDPALDLALGQAARLVGRAAAFAFALDEIGIDLPPASGAQVDQAQLRAIAGLYLVSELERAGVIEAAESLAALSGGRDYGAAAADIAAFWRGRHERLSPAERHASFAALFGQEDAELPAGAPVNAHFFDAMVEMTEALYKLDELAAAGERGGIAQQARVRRAARTLVEGLAGAASGLTLFLAEDLLQTMRSALAIFRHPAILGLFAVRDLWGAVASARRLGRLPTRPAADHMRRGKAGMTVLAWVAEASPHLEEGGQPLVGLDNPVIAAAIEWLEASLSIADSIEPPSQQKPPEVQGSPWASVGS